MEYARARGVEAWVSSSTTFAERGARFGGSGSGEPNGPRSGDIVLSELHFADEIYANLGNYKKETIGRQLYVPEKKQLTLRKNEDLPPPFQTNYENTTNLGKMNFET